MSPRSSPPRRPSEQRGSGLVWNRNGTELSYVEGTGPTVARLQTEPFRILSRQTVFDTSDFWVPPTTRRRHFDVGLDDERFLMLSTKGTEEDQTRINVV